MPGPHPVKIESDKSVHEGRLDLMRRHSTPQQMVPRARIVLLAAEGKNNAQIGRDLAVTTDTARLWPDRWVSFAGIPLGELSVRERLEDALRPGHPTTINAE